ncbi:MAG TPA: M20 family metallopeptidase [Acidobacteriota bacterium]|jgi:acetylornithine deacetylase
MQIATNSVPFREKQREELFDLLAELVSIPSVNPNYQDGTGERAITEFIADYLNRLDIRVELQELVPGRPNVVATLPGRDAQRILLLEAHVDTASVEGMAIPPFRPDIADGVMYGRGSCDTKAGLAGMLYALRQVRESGRPATATIILAATVDEEYAFGGVALLVRSGIRADAAVVAEPTDLDVVVAHKGCLRWRIRTLGRAAHSAKVHLGINAIVKMSGIIQEIETRLVPRYRKTEHPLLGSPTVNVGLISGGVMVNTVPDSSVIEVDRRLLPGEDRESVWAEFSELLDRLKANDPDLSAMMEPPMLEVHAMETPVGGKIVQIARQASDRVLGRARISGVPYGTDASELNRAGIQSIVLGPGNIDQAHSAVEYVNLEQVVQACRIYGEIMRAF